MEKREIGAWGERKAASYLRLHGYKIVCMNYSCRQGEIDVIAENRKYIVFVDLKFILTSDHVDAR